jgi:ATP-dependent 26S proteasome regulatory subunit
MTITPSELTMRSDTTRFQHSASVVTAPHHHTRGEEFFSTSVDHVLAELETVRLLVELQVIRMREASMPGAEYNGLVIQEEEVTELLKRPSGALRSAVVPESNASRQVEASLTQWTSHVASRREESLKHAIKLRLAELQQLFGLTSFDISCLMICVAAELDLRYEKLYAYLQDDVTKKRPSIDLVLNLLCQSFEEKLQNRRRFTRSAPLIARRLLLIGEDPSQPSSTLLGKWLRVDGRVIDYLLGSDEIDSRLHECTSCIHPQKSIEELVLTDEQKHKLTSLPPEISAKGRFLLYMQGSYGYGRKATAEALCCRLQLGLLIVDVNGVLSNQPMPPHEIFELILREAALQSDALYLEGFDTLVTEDKAEIRKAILRQLRSHSGVIFFAGESAWEPRDEIGDVPFARIEFSRPDYQDRTKLWRQTLEENGQPSLDASTLANKFRFSGGQIKDSIETARHLARWRHADRPEIDLSDLNEACRLHSSRKLSALGRKIKPHRSWGDLVLPEDRIQQLREICNSIKYRSVVLEDWGFDRKLSLGKGLNILFAGPSGTGKTMAAEIMAGELELDLYKLDLSTVVSKYIGETEKNLARIFAEAECSNAILFFDEADALFGKRSEVRDSHDRYANIEINYLLQKMEEHEGVVILATNFRRNMDDAFVRRMHFTVEFPLPSEVDRRRIWEQIWPKDTPQAADLDFEFMARRFEIAGGNIRNIAMVASFLAACDGGVVSMSHLLHGTRREYQKMGKVVMQGEFQ